MTKRSRRDAILDAALRLSASRGLDGVSTAEVCRASGATNGSVFHFFPTKDDLHAALYLRALATYQEAIASGLERSRSAREGVRGVVLDHVAWVAAHPAEARFLHEGRRGATSASLLDEIEERNARFFGRFAAWLRAQAAAGAIRKVPPDVVFAIVFGPVSMITRDFMRGTDAERLREVAPSLADAAWSALAPRRGRTKRT
jgi:AcrR family transcriptional regulator